MTGKAQEEVVWKFTGQIKPGKNVMCISRGSQDKAVQAGWKTTRVLEKARAQVQMCTNRSEPKGSIDVAKSIQSIYRISVPSTLMSNMGPMSEAEAAC